MPLLALPPVPVLGSVARGSSVPVLGSAVAGGSSALSSTGAVLGSSEDGAGVPGSSDAWSSDDEAGSSALPSAPSELLSSLALPSAAGSSESWSSDAFGSDSSSSALSLSAFSLSAFFVSDFASGFVPPDFVPPDSLVVDRVVVACFAGLEALLLDGRLFVDVRVGVALTRGGRGEAVEECFVVARSLFVLDEPESEEPESEEPEPDESESDEDELSAEAWEDEESPESSESSACAGAPSRTSAAKAAAKRNATLRTHGRRSTRAAAPPVAERCRTGSPCRTLSIRSVNQDPGPDGHGSNENHALRSLPGSALPARPPIAGDLSSDARTSTDEHGGSGR